MCKNAVILSEAKDPGAARSTTQAARHSHGVAGSIV